jgi:anti-sigma regulatory factor (Ser/Thr protein kinase)
VVAEISLRLVGGPDAPAEARQALRRFHPDLAPDLLQVAQLLTSELVSNAVKHSKTASIALRATVVPHYVRVEVADDGPGFAPAESVTPPASGIGGWGLHLVDELSSRWGTVEADGARVWFEIDR